MNNFFAFCKKKRTLLLNISFIMLWLSFAAGYPSGTGDIPVLWTAALIFMAMSVIPAAFAKK